MSTKSAPRLNYGPLGAFVGFQLRRAFLRSNQLFGRLVADVGLAPGHFGVLTLISLNPGSLQREIADAAGLDRSSLTQMLDQLSKLDYVERRAGPDRRSFNLFVTAAGAAACASARSKVRKHEKLIRGSLGREEVSVLLTLLKRLADGTE
jgi:DNA-binding MarR family transcriptional regulator